MRSKSTLDPAIYFSYWLLDSTTRRFLCHFSQSEWLRIAKYCLILGLGYLEFHGLNIYMVSHEELKAIGENSLLDLQEFTYKGAPQEKEFEPLFNSTRERKSVAFEIQYVNVKNQKLRTRNSHILKKLRPAGPKSRGPNCFKESLSKAAFPTNWSMFLVFRRFFAQFPEVLWSRFVKYVFCLGLNYILYLGVPIHLLSLDLFRDLVFEYGCTLPGECPSRELTRNKIRSLSRMTYRKDALVPSSLTGLSQNRIQRETLCDSPSLRISRPRSIGFSALGKHRRMKTVQYIFPIQFIVPYHTMHPHVMLDRVYSHYPDWWVDGSGCCSAFDWSTINVLKEKCVTSMAKDVLTLLKTQQRAIRTSVRKSTLLRERASHQRVKYFGQKKKNPGEANQRLSNLSSVKITHKQSMSRRLVDHAVGHKRSFTKHHVPPTSWSNPDISSGFPYKQPLEKKYSDAQNSRCAQFQKEEALPSLTTDNKETFRSQPLPDYIHANRASHNTKQYYWSDKQQMRSPETTYLSSTISGYPEVDDTCEPLHSLLEVIQRQSQLMRKMYTLGITLDENPKSNSFLAPKDKNNPAQKNDNGARTKTVDTDSKPLEKKIHTNHVHRVTRRNTKYDQDAIRPASSRKVAPQVSAQQKVTLKNTQCFSRVTCLYRTSSSLSLNLSSHMYTTPNNKRII